MKDQIFTGSAQERIDLANRAEALRLKLLLEKQRGVDNSSGFQLTEENLDTTGKSLSGGLRPEHPTINHILAKLP